jgi:copper homeostasis protein
MKMLEVCVQGVAAAIAAEQGGADRVELCERLEVGGVTPSAGAIAVACRRLEIPVHVLVRPREGDFCPDLAEFEAMEHDVALARQLGAAGVVIGLLNPDRTIDGPRTKRLASLARPLSVTFHKAFDETPDPDAALETLCDLGIERILTSGQATTAREGLACLASLHARAAGRIVILAAGQLRAADLPPLRAAGLTEFHAGSAATRHGRTDPDAVRALRSALDRAGC